MRANKCDRCKQFYEDYEGLGYIPNGNKYNSMMICGLKARSFDLCPACMKSLIAWIECEKTEGEE